jgi:CO/xanthine dehydrogenase Mo-binding subunit
MPSVGAIIASAVQGAVSALLAPLVRWWQDRQQQQVGKLEQHNADAAAALSADQQARIAEANNAALSDSDLNAKLRRP